MLNRLQTQTYFRLYYQAGPETGKDTFDSSFQVFYLDLDLHINYLQ